MDHDQSARAHERVSSTHGRRADLLHEARGRTARWGWCRLTGAGDRGLLCGRATRKQRQETGDYGPSESGLFEVEHLHRLIRDIPKPVIAAVNGYAIGGGQVLHVLCDLTIASDNAVFGRPARASGPSTPVSAPAISHGWLGRSEPVRSGFYAAATAEPLSGCRDVQSCSCWQPS